MLSLSPKTPHSRPVTRLNQALLPSETWTCRPAPAAAAGAPSHYINFYRELKASLPLCSPRKTSLNFLKGFPKSLPTDILKRRKKRGGVRTRCSWACSHSSSEKMLDGKGGGAASRSLSLFVMRTHTHTLLLYRSVTLWLFFSLPPCAHAWYRLRDIKWRHGPRCVEKVLPGAALMFSGFSTKFEDTGTRSVRALTLYSTAALCGAFSENTFLKCQKEKKLQIFFVSSFIRKLFYFVLFSQYGYMNVLHILLLLHFNEMFYLCHFYYWILSL